MFHLIDKLPSKGRVIWCISFNVILLSSPLEGWIADVLFYSIPFYLPSKGGFRFWVHVD